MHKVSEEGEVLGDLSSLALIPGAMRWGSYIVSKGFLYAIGYRKWEENKCYRFLSFDGMSWCPNHYCLSNISFLFCCAFLGNS